MSLYLGIDGGGTKTTAAIASEDRVLAVATGGGSNLVRTPRQQVRASLHSAIQEACRAAGIKPEQIDFACVGAAGASRPEISAQIVSIIRELIPATIQVHGDMAIAHACAFSGSAGIVVISGTGSIAYGQNEEGNTARAGGWGRITSDDGSGYWIGRRAVATTLRAEDAGESTTLMSRIMRSWHLATAAEVGLAANSTPVPNFSKLFPEVLAAASGGDVLAAQVLSDAGAELADLAGIVLHRLWPENQHVEIAMAGGIFAQSSIVRESFGRHVNATRADSNVFLSTSDPVQGAIYLARKLSQYARAQTDKTAGAE